MVAKEAISGLIGATLGFGLGRLTAPTKFKYVEPLPEAEEIATNITVKHTHLGIVNVTVRHCVHTAVGTWGKRCTYLMRVGDDVEAIMDVAYAEYAEGWFWTVEVARVGWGKIEIDGYGKNFVVEEVYGDDIIHLGYVSFRITEG